MLSLAQFALRGPLYASGVAALATALPLLFWVGAAVVALVILRLGISQGLNIGLWALLPALGWSWFGQDPTALWVLLHAVAMAIALRLTRTWEVTLLTGSGLGIVSGFLIPLLYPEMIGQLVEAGTSFYREYNPDIASQLGDRLEHLVREAMNASLAGTFLLLGMLSVMLGRAWQAGLFNPGGFREEFHAFRLSPAAAVICVGATVAGASVEVVPFLVSWAGHCLC